MEISGEVLRAPVAKVYLTQGWGENLGSYAVFGLRGHNGLDFRAFLPSGERCYQEGVSEVLAPHSGRVIENLYDAGGYGYYVKIENEREGSVLAHFGAASEKRVGEEVRQGEVIGYAGSSGNSTGIHLHWGYYLFPRNRADGYLGFINQEGKFAEALVRESEEKSLVKQEEKEQAMITIPQATFEELVTKASKYDELIKTK